MSMEQNVILEYERGFWNAVGRDPTFIEENLGDDGHLVLRDQVLDKTATLAKLSTFTPWETVEFGDVRHRTYAQGVVALLYSVRATGDDVQFYGAVTSVYVDRRRRPVMVLHQQSEPSGPSVRRH